MTNATRLLAALLTAFALAACDDPVTPESVVDVYTTPNAFSPFTSTILAGGTVRYHIFGDEHNVIFAKTTPGYPADINVVKDVIVERTFLATGTFRFTCTVHPGMDGEVVVK
jgi:plastocyanin